ncbi:MAG TPA: tRNA pseudouridine(55) synthase TruB [Pyrinomonadaceae bacterium]|nr:tRNA pseudouridine(55) synthase TruB [Pyrinomonadaceae bacterium]
MVDGILIVDKPAGITSHDVVARARRILRTKRIGHTGTLDPFATGVMVILVERATRLAQFLDKDRKEYAATVRFGFETDTGDRTGELRITNYELREFSEDELEEVLKNFRGEIEQMPPMYSAKKIAGKKLYELARKGVEIERKAVKVNIYELELSTELRITNYELRDKTEENSATDNRLLTTDRFIKVSCSAGTYIRALAEDIGRKLRTGAHLAALRRTGAGRFGIERAVTLEELEEISDSGKLDEVLISANEAVSHLPEIKLSSEEISNIKNGKKLKTDLPQSANETYVRLTGEENLIAVGVYNSEEKTVQPKVVLI